MYRLIAEFISSVNSQGLYLGLYLLALLALFYLAWLDKDNMVTEAGRRYFVAGIIVSAVLFCPVTAYVYVTKIATMSYGISQLMRALPLVPMIAYAFVSLSEHTMRKNSGPVIYGIAVLLTIVLCGSIIPYSTGLKLSDNFVSAEDRAKEKELTEIIRFIEEYAESANAALTENYKEKSETDILATENVKLSVYKPTVLADRETLSQIRRYSGKVYTIYGRDMWSPLVNREILYEGEHRYPDNLRWLYTYTEAIAGVTAETAEDTIAFTGLDGAPRTLTLAELSNNLVYRIRECDANILILPTQAAENPVVNTVVADHLWMKTPHYYVYTLK